MAKKNMDLLLSNIMGDAVIRPQDKYEPPVGSKEVKASIKATRMEEKTADTPWKHFSFICSVELVDKIQAIAHKEGFTIRALMEFLMRQGIDKYESKHVSHVKYNTHFCQPSDCFFFCMMKNLQRTYPNLLCG